VAELVATASAAARRANVEMSGLTLSLTGFGAWSLDPALKLSYPDWLLPAWLHAVAVVPVVALIAQRTRGKGPT